MTEAEKLAQDRTLYGCSFESDGKRVDPRYVHYANGVYWITCPKCQGTGPLSGCDRCTGSGRLTAEAHAPAAWNHKGPGASDQPKD